MVAGEFKEHNCQLEQSLMGDEGCLPLVSITNVNVVVPPSDIQLGEDLGVFNLVNEVCDEGQEICIFDGVTTDILIVLAWSEGIGCILPINEEEGCGLRGIQGANSS